MIAPLEDRIVRDGDYRSFVAHAEAAVSRVRPNTPGVLPMRTAMARILRDELGNPEAADRQLAATIQAFPESMETRLALATGLVGRNDDAALAELRRAVSADPTAPGPFEALVTLARKTGRTEIAVMLASAAALLGEHRLRGRDRAREPRRRSGRSPRRSSTTRRCPGSSGPSRARFLRERPRGARAVPRARSSLAARRCSRRALACPRRIPIATTSDAIAMTLGVYAPSVHRGVGREVALLLTEPRALVLGNDLLADAGRPLAAFHGAYACARMAANGSLYVAPRQQVVALARRRDATRRRRPGDPRFQEAHRLGAAAQDEEGARAHRHRRRGRPPRGARRLGGGGVAPRALLRGRALPRHARGRPGARGGCASRCHASTIAVTRSPPTAASARCSSSSPHRRAGTCSSASTARSDPGGATIFARSRRSASFPPGAPSGGWDDRAAPA